MPFDNPIVKSDADYLRAAKALIDHPAKWCKHAYRKDDKMCTLNAITRAVTGRDHDVSLSYMPEQKVNRLCALLTADEPDQWPPSTEQTAACNLNNRSTHAQLMAKFDAAIERASH